MRKTELRGPLLTTARIIEEPVFPLRLGMESQATLRSIVRGAIFLWGRERVAVDELLILAEKLCDGLSQVGDLVALSEHDFVNLRQLVLQVHDGFLDGDQLLLKVGHEWAAV